MRYSLISRFRGTILGVLLGEILTKSLDKLPSVETLHTTSLLGVRMAVVGAESLISMGRFDLDDWLGRQQECSNLDESLTVSPAAILATLPLGLFFHENTIKLRENLLLLVKMWENDPLVRDGTLALAFAIAQSLREKLSSVTLLHQTISFIGETSTSVPQKLLKVNYLLNCQAGLEKAQAELITQEKLSSTIAMAFYCFLDTLEDFRLSVLRASQNEDALQGVSAITGALSGAYNSTAGIPITWQILLQQAKSKESELTSFSQVLKLADALVAVWSGVYNGSYSTELTDENAANLQSWLSLQAIASQSVIR